MSRVKGRGLASIGKRPASAAHRDDAPANPGHLAALVTLAGNGAGLGDLALEMPSYRPDRNRVCGECLHQALCARRVEVGLWAVCEEPWGNDLLVLEMIIGDQKR